MPSTAPSDLHSLSATQAVRLIQAGKLRPEALMDACLDHISRREPGIRAFAHLDPAQTHAAVAGAPKGQLQGIGRRWKRFTP